MKGPFILVCIFVLACAGNVASGQCKPLLIKFELFNDTFEATIDTSVIITLDGDVSAQKVQVFYNQINRGNYYPLVNTLKAYKEKHRLNDWLYYQLVRRVAQQISAKTNNYARYTLYKWFLLTKSGYDARLALANRKLIFYIYNDEDISDIPFFMIDGKKFMCLNYHDYPNTDLHQEPPVPVNINVPEAKMAFSYEVTRMPEFKRNSYVSKNLVFVYNHKAYNFEVKLSKEVDSIFNNYPVVDYKSYFNIPLTHETYSSLIPILRKNVKGMDQKKGVDYLMRFTRYAFLYEDDEQNFGREKRLSPEETLFSSYSDCDDRAGLFFYLVKEIYNLPMIALLFPTHITVGVQFNKPEPGAIIYNGKAYSVCEPTEQPEDLRIGQLSSRLKNLPYEVVYQYQPVQIVR